LSKQFSASGEIEVIASTFDVVQVHDFMRHLAATHPNWVTVSNQGQSHEGRDMLMLNISSGGAANNAIFVDGGN